MNFQILIARSWRNRGYMAFFRKLLNQSLGIFQCFNQSLGIFQCFNQSLGIGQFTSTGADFDLVYLLNWL